MITIKVYLVAFVIFVSSNMLGQTNALTHKEEPSRNIKKNGELIKVTQMYFEKTSILKTYFIKGEVKSGFPGYNYALSKDENGLAIEKWLMIEENRKALTAEGLISIEQYLKSK